MKILLVDDHTVLRRGMRELLEEELTHAEFEEAGSGEEAVALVHRGSFDLVVLDITMPRRGGLEALNEIVAARPGLPVLILSYHAEEQYAIRALRSGAAGYITKDSAPEELVAAAKKVLAGGKYVSAALAERLATGLSSPSGTVLHDALSDREMLVLRMLSGGRTVKQIGAELSLSEKTVSTYRSRLLEKMKMKNNAELMRYAMRAGLVD